MSLSLHPYGEHARWRYNIDDHVLFEWLPGMALLDPQRIQEWDYYRKKLVDAVYIKLAWQSLMEALSIECRRPGAATLKLLDTLDSLFRPGKSYQRGTMVGQWHNVRRVFLALAEIARRNRSQRLATVLSQYFIRNGRAISTTEPSSKLGQWGDALVRAGLQREELVSCLREIVYARPDISVRDFQALALGTNHSRRFMSYLESFANSREIDMDYHAFQPARGRVQQLSRPSMLNRRTVSAPFLQETIGRRGYDNGDDDSDMPAMGALSRPFQNGRITHLTDTNERLERIMYGLEMMSKIINKPTRDFRCCSPSFDDHQYEHGIRDF